MGAGQYGQEQEVRAFEGAIGHVESWAVVPEEGSDLWAHDKKYGEPDLADYHKYGVAEQERICYGQQQVAGHVTPYNFETQSIDWVPSSAVPVEVPDLSMDPEDTPLPCVRDPNHTHGLSST